jgi:hypothetical protein
LLASATKYLRRIRKSSKQSRGAGRAAHTDTKKQKGPQTTHRESPRSKGVQVSVPCTRTVPQARPNRAPSDVHRPRSSASLWKDPSSLRNTDKS